MKKLAVITGASSGIGRAIAEYYKGEGFFVIGINRTVYTDGELFDSPVHYNMSVDLNTSEIRDVGDKMTKAFGHADVLVNNAGVMFLEPNDLVANFNETFDPRTINLNLIAPLLLCKSIAIKKPGHVINIASVSGIVGDPEAPVYSAAKAAIINLTRSLAKIFAPDIRYNCISPGFFNTNLVPGPAPRELIEQVPMKREAEPREIIPVVDMLQKSTYMTGANIVIDGGLSL